MINVYKEQEASLNETNKIARQEEITEIEQDIQKFQKNASSLIQIRQNELVNPLYKLIGDELKSVAEEDKFTQVFTIDNSIAYLDPNLDITIAVMEKMGIPIKADEE